MKITVWLHRTRLDEECSMPRLLLEKDRSLLEQGDDLSR